MNPLNNNNAKYLVLEDNRVDQLILHELMIEIGIQDLQIEYATAISSIPGDSYNYILCDLNVDDSSHLDTVKSIRFKFPHAIIIVLSGLNDIELALDSIQAGAQDFLIKGETSAIDLRKTILFATERHDLARQIYLNEARFRGLIENNYDGIFIQNEDMHICYASSSIKNITEYSADELEGISLIELVHPEDHQKLDDIYAQLLKGVKKVFRYKTRIRHKFGSYLWIDVTLSDQRLTPGIKGIVSNFKNIDQEQKAIEQQIHSERRLKEIINAVPGAVLSYQLFPDGTDKLLYLSKGAEKLWNVSRDNALKDINEIWRLMDKKVYQELKKSISNSAKDLSVWNYKFMVGQKNDTIWINAIGTPYKQHDGSIIWNTLVFDITEQVKTERALQESNERFILAGNATNDLIWDWDLTDNMPIDGKSKDSPMIKWVNSIYDPDRDKVISRMNKVIYQHKRNHWKDEFRILNDDGKIAYMSGQGYVIYDQNKQPLRMVGALQDLTEKRKLLYDITERNKELNCLYSISRMISDPSLNIIDILKKIVDIVPPSFQYPENTSCRITFQHKIYTSKNFSISTEVQMANIIAENKPYGIIEVFFSGDINDKIDSSPFLKEEENLINAIAGLLGTMLENRNAEEYREKLNNQLKRSLKKASDYKLALDQSAIIAITDKSGLIIDVNKNYCKTSHFSRDESIGMNLIDSLLLNNENIKHELNRAIKRGLIWQGEVKAYTKNGSDYWLHTNLVPFKNSYGQIEKYMSISNDISERKMAEEHLRKSEADLQAIFDNTSDGYFLLNEHLAIISLNSKSTEIFKRSSNLLIGVSILDIIPESVRPEMELNLSELLKGKIYSFEDEWKDPKENRWYFMSVLPVVTNKVITGACISLKNITSKKLAEQELKRLAANLESLINSTEDAFILIDTDLKIKLFNKQAEKNSKLYSRRKLKKGNNVLDHIPEPRQALVKAIEKSMKGITADYMYTFQTSSRELAMHVIVNPIFTPDHQIQELSVVIRDITERKVYEKALIFQQQLLMNSQQLADLGSFEWDILNDQITATEEFYKILEIHNVSFHDVKEAFFNKIHHEDRAIVEDTIRIAVQNKRSFNLYFRSIASNGQNKVIRGKGMVNVGRDGNVFKIFCVLQDVTEQNSADQSLQLGQEQERNRLAKDLHDDIGQLLTATKFRLEAIDMKDDLILEQQVDDVKELLSTTIQEVRNISRNLSTKVLEHYGLKTAIIELCNTFTTDNLKINIVYNLVTNLNIRLQTNIYRILQEALNNVIKYSHASRCDISLIETNGLLLLQVIDNGKGFNLEEKGFDQGNGLHNMKERTHLFLGQFEIFSREGEGTSVICKFPVIKYANIDEEN